jgi:wyosine [tRNA(Phe)-imidazoG37] synthetase (radical SAM superfamily)
MPPTDIDTLKQPHASAVYGPVDSWRVGKSLGVDMLLQTSICSFNCIYCQLGDIQQKTIERKIYVPTEQVEWDFKNSAWEQADIVTFSGSGEPTLALNLAEVIGFIKDYSHKPVWVLTNGTLLHDPQVRQDLAQADQVAVKIDATDDALLQRINRPVTGVTLDKILEGTRLLRAEYPGKLAFQCMFMPGNQSDLDKLADIINTIQPDEVQLNTPKRPYPLQWVLDSRGNHTALQTVPTATLRTITPDEAQALESELRAKITAPLISVYRNPQPV